MAQSGPLFTMRGWVRDPAFDGALITEEETMIVVFPQAHIAASRSLSLRLTNDNTAPDAVILPALPATPWGHRPPGSPV